MSYTTSDVDVDVGLTDEQIDGFVTDGYVRVDEAFPRTLATQARKRMWRDIPADPNDPTTWNAPVVHLWCYWQQPFLRAANAPRLHRAFDQLIGVGRWQPLEGVGQFVVRFPHPDEPFDTGWHIDASFPPPELDGVEPDESTDFRTYRVNVTSRGRALLALMLFSDTGPDDAPTLLRVGSHVDMARQLAPAGDAGLGADMDVTTSAHRPVVAATGPAGTVYLCHPFTVHAAQPHRGRTPRFLAQPGIIPTESLCLDRPDGTHAPVETAIRRALGRQP